jgi:rhamnogalacturonan endolyase
MHITTTFTVGLALGQGVNAAFGFTSTSTGYKVDTDGGLTFVINKYISAILNRL